MSQENDISKASYNINYSRWDKVVTTSQLVIACVVFLTEVVNNIILYQTRSQGYGPDTIVVKLLRYLVLTTVINFGLFLISKIVLNKCNDLKNRRYIVMLMLVLICTDVAFSHYQFATALAIFVIPLILSILYEDWKLLIFTFVISMVGELAAIIARAVDSEYNKDIGPEAAIVCALMVSVFIFSKIIHATLIQRRDDVEEAIIKVEKTNAAADKMAFSFRMLETLTGTIDAKDKYTNGHSKRVAVLSTKLAEGLGWEEEQVKKLSYEALLHDIGKIGVPDVILNKPSKLTGEEFGMIKSHTVVGSQILKNMVAFPDAAEVAKYHHERYDGKGYPSGIKGTDIPLNARVVCIADAYDAMSSDRVYRKALPKEAIREELVNGRGSQFDPEMLDVFLKLFDEDKLHVTSSISFFEEIDDEQQGVLNDIEDLIGRISTVEEQCDSVSDFGKFYEYLSNIGVRYNRSIEVLSIVVEPEEGRNYSHREEEISDILQMAIRKSIRSVDVFYKYSATKFMLILLDAGTENIDVIQNRIQYDFYSNVICEGYKLNFSLADKDKKPEQFVHID